MIRRTGILALVALAVPALVFVAPTSAWAVDIIESQEPGGVPEAVGAGFQAGTCTADPCSAKTPSLFFTQAAGHPADGFVQIIVKHVLSKNGRETPIAVGTLKTVVVDLPPGLSVNPQAAPQCPHFEVGPFFPTCPADTQVGVTTIFATTTDNEGGSQLTLPVAVYNMVPREGEPARFAFDLPLGLGEVFLNAGIAWDSDYHEYFTIHAPSIENLGIVSDRLVFDGRLGQQGASGALLTNPSTCQDPEVEPFKRLYTTTLHADSVEEPAPDDGFDLTAPIPPSAAFLSGSQAVLSPLPKGAKPEGCDKIPFEPSTSADTATAQTDSPTAATVNIGVPFEPSAAIYNSNVKEARVTLPSGMGINPAAADGLQACTDAQFGKGSRRAVACPAASKIGTVSIQTPPLPDGTLAGNVYLGQQLSHDPNSGQEFRLFLDAESASRGVSIRLVGNVEADPKTGQLTAVVHEAPQLPFSSVQVKLDGGPKATLTSPPTCGPHVTTHAMTAWSGTPDGGPQDSGFILSNAPDGGSCAKTMAERPFSPSLSASPKTAAAHAFAPLSIRIARNDGQQELKGVDVTLPPGTTAKLAGVPYCPESAIAAAAARTGTAEMASASCPANSQVGVASVLAGSGSSPLQLAGKVFLAGPYKGASLSLVVVTPALAGPFDLGTVVVRVALSLDPETAQIHTVSDSIPDVFGGVKLDVRAIALDINRDNFTLNGTNCSRLSGRSTLAGGGADPTNPAAFSAFSASNPLQLSGCEKLPFKPKLSLRLFGKTKRAQHPKLRAVLKARPGDANIQTASVALPHALFLDQASLAAVCTRVQFAANQCPKQSVYGYATATTPLLGKPLSGPVYLRSSTHTLPDLVAHLEGQVDIDLVARVDSFHGGIRTTFDHVPDVPVSTFTLTVPGGKHGLLVASRNLCQEPVRGIMRLKGQNGKKVNRQTTLRTPCGHRGA